MEHECNRKSVFVEEMPDTLIEGLFLKATQDCKNGSVLRKQWMIDKNIYSKETATTVLDFEHFSLHDTTHSISILNAIGLLMGKEKLELFDIGDLWLLLEVAYSHDIGMAVTYEELRELWVNDGDFRQYFQDSLDSSDLEEKEKAEYIRQVDKLLLKRERFTSSETDTITFDEGWPVKLKKYIILVAAAYIRKYHAERSFNKICKYADEEISEIDSRQYKIVARIAYLHTEDFDGIFKFLRHREVFFGKYYMHPQFVAALLRIGDLLDMDNNRFDKQILKHFGKLPHISELHLKKHKSLMHLDISAYQILAEANSDDIEVCIEIAKWFQLLENENYAFIAHWNQIAPKELGGCTLSICVLKIYYKEEEFKLSGDDSYQLDKQHAIKLLIGDNIYGGSLDFLREYVQNAIDASKLQFEREYREGQLDYLLMDDIEDVNRCLPFEFKKEAFEKLKVKVTLQIVDRDYLEISIIDFGVGIEEKGLEALTTIGSGWKNREHYQKQFKDLAFWLDPTAGFGIGIQSAFMVSDQVEFYTKSVMENRGSIVRLNDPRKDGNITKQMSNKRDNGTEVRIKVPIIKFMEGGLYRQRYKEDVADYITQYSISGEDYFTEDEVIRNIAEGMEKFLRNQIINSLFPIYIQYEYGYRGYIYSEFWFKNDEGKKKNAYQLRQFKKYGNESEIYYCIDDKFSKIYVIDCADKCMVSVEFAKENKGLLRYCYKGIAVIDEYEEQYFFNATIDISDKNVEKYLKVNRKEFIKNFPKNDFSREKITTALKIYIEKITEFKYEITDFIEEYQLGNIVFSILKYLPMNETNLEFIENVAPALYDCDDVVGIKSITWKENGFSCSNSFVGTNFYKIILNPTLQSKIFLVETEEVAEFDINMSEDMLKIQYSDSEFLDDLCVIRNYIGEKNSYIVKGETEKAEIIMDICGNDTYIVGCGKVNLKVYGCKHKKVGRKESEVDFEKIFSVGRRTIIKNAKQYEKLHVKELPFTQNENDLDKEVDYLIMPMDAMLIGKIDSFIRKEAGFDVFFQTIEDANSAEHKAWNLLIDWVYRHQSSEMKYDKKTIENEYKRLLMDYYNFRRPRINL